MCLIKDEVFLPCCLIKDEVSGLSSHLRHARLPLALSHRVHLGRDYDDGRVGRLRVYLLDPESQLEASNLGF